MFKMSTSGIVQADNMILYVINVPACSGLLSSTLGQNMLALHSFNTAAKYQPKDHSIFLYRAKIYEQVLCYICTVLYSIYSPLFKILMKFEWSGCVGNVVVLFHNCGQNKGVVYTLHLKYVLVSKIWYV